MKKLLLLLALCPIIGFSQTIRTIIGDGTPVDTGIGGPATAAKVYQPLGIIYDGKGSLYFDVDNDTVSCIRKIDAAGVYTVYAGKNIAGYTGDGGPASAATMNAPGGMCYDKFGNLYIAEAGNSVIRKISTTGIISTVAGNGVTGYTGDHGPATNAALGAPISVKVDTAMNIYIPDYNNNVIRKVNKAGIITTIAGTGVPGFSGDKGPATAATFNRPSDIALDSMGRIYISDYTNQVIRMIGLNDSVYTAVGTPSGGSGGDGGPATAAGLYGPFGIIFDSSWNLLITDSYNNRIRKVNKAGIISTIAGNGYGTTSHSGAFAGDGGPATAAELYWPAFTAIGAAGTFYITDESNHAIRRVDTAAPKNTLEVAPTTNIAERLLVIPNPSKGDFELSGITATVETRGTVMVRNITGQIVYRGVIPIQQGSFKSRINISEALPPGNYLLELKTKTSFQQANIVIDK